MARRRGHVILLLVGVVAGLVCWRGMGPFAQLPSQAAGRDGRPGVALVPPLSGRTTGVGAASAGSGPLFSFPSAIAVEAAGTLVVVDADLGAVLRVDPANGNRIVVSR